MVIAVVSTVCVFASVELFAMATMEPKASWVIGVATSFVATV